MKFVVTRGDSCLLSGYGGVLMSTARVWRPTSAGGRIAVAVPYSKGTRLWLREVCGPGTRPEFDRERKVWTVARPHFRRIVEALASRYGVVDVYVDHTVRSTCGKLCREAEGDDCTCSCLGDNHGAHSWRREWHQVDEHWLIRNEKMRRRYRVTAEQVGAAPLVPSPRVPSSVERPAWR
jgi:hypothetical protein